MLTFTGQKNYYGELTTGTANTANLNFGGRIILAETRRLANKMSGYLLQTTGTAQAVINQQEYELPNRLKKLRSATFTIGSTVYPVERSPSREHWDYLNYTTATAFTADYPQWWYSIGRKILFWPTPASGSATISYEYDKRFIDQSVDDYTTGNVGTATVNSTAVVGVSTVWTSSMEGRYLQIAKSNTANNNGDGDFYEIADVTNGTTLALVKPYGGDTITGASATYLIGEVSPLPDGFHELPVYRAAEIYYGRNDEGRANYFKGLADNLESDLLGFNDISDSVVIGRDERTINDPNFAPSGLTDSS